MEVRVRVLSTLIHLIILPCVFTVHIIEDLQTVSIHPKGPILVRYGDDLTILCTVNGEGTSANLAFTIGAKPTPFEVFNDTTIKIFIKKPEQHASYGYRCRNNKTRTGNGETVFVTVAAPPTNVTDFKCISYNLDVLKCSWTTPEKIFRTDYNLTMVDRGIRNCGQFHEVRDTTPTEYYCIWDTSSTEPRYFTDVKQLSFKLKSHNIIEDITQEFKLDHYTVVKPNKPINLTVVSERPHNVLLQWGIPNNIFLLLQDGSDELEHKIEYHIDKIDNTSYFRPVDTSILPKKVNYKLYKINLTDLPYAHMKYKVRMSIKLRRAESDEYWSDFNELDFYTASERPRRPPDMIAGGFHHNKFGESRKMYVYWKQLEEYEEAGANFTYMIVITMQGPRNVTYMPKKDKSLGYLYLSNVTLEAMQISIWSLNEIGQSMDSSHLYIPPERETRSLRLTSFTKLAYENGTYELSWVGVSNIDNYTLFWCHHTTDICNGRINFKAINPNDDRHVINLPKDYRYQFAISANNGTESSGMIWPKCDISIDGVAMHGFGVQFTEKTRGKNFVTLKWSMECTLRYGFLTGYNITYHPVLDKSTTSKDTIGSTKPIIIKLINNTKQKNINITGLRSYTTYQFNISLITMYGLKTIEKATVLIKTLEDTPTTPRNVKISNVQSEDLIMSWDPPLYLNGHFGNISYEIFNNENEMNKTILQVVKHKDITWTKELRIEVKLEKLKSFTNYSLSVRACNEVIATCSNRTSDTYVSTKIGKPSKLTVTSNDTIIKWEPPKFPGGKVNFYEIKIITDDNSNIENTTNLEYPLKACEGSEKQVTYQVRAINLDNLAYPGALAYQKNFKVPERGKNDEIIFPGDWSDKNKVMCIYKQKDLLAYILLTLGVMIGVVSWGIKWYFSGDNFPKSIEPIYPPGLLNPEKDQLYFATMPSEKEEAQEDHPCKASNPSHDKKDKTKHYFKVARSNMADLAGGSNNADVTCNHSSNSGVGKEMPESQNCTEAVLKAGLTVNLEEPKDMLTDQPIKQTRLKLVKENAIKHHLDATTNQHIIKPQKPITDGYVNPHDVKNGLRHVKEQPTDDLTQVDPRALAVKDHESPSNTNRQSYIPVSAVSRPISSKPSKSLTTPNGYTVLEDTKHLNIDSSRPEEVKVFVNLSKDDIPEISVSPSNSKGQSYVQVGHLSSSKSTKPNKPLTTANGYTVLEDTKLQSNDSTCSAKVEELVDLSKDELARDFLLKRKVSTPNSKEQSYIQLGVISSLNSPIPKTANGYTILKDTNKQLPHSSGPMPDDLINQSAVELPSTNQHFKSKQEFNSQPTRVVEKEKKTDGKSFKQPSSAAEQLIKGGYILRPEVMVKPQPHCHNNSSQHPMQSGEIVTKKATKKKTTDTLPLVKDSMSQTSYSKEPIEKNIIAIPNDVPTKSVKPSTNGYVTPEEAKKKCLAKISSIKQLIKESPN